MILGLLGCAARLVPHYEPVGFALDPVEPRFVAQLPALVAESVGTRRVRALDGPGAPATWPPEALYAVYACSRGWTRGAELDLVVDVGRGGQPVTLWWTPDRRVTVAWSEIVSYAPDTTPGALVARSGIGGLEGVVPWMDPELAAVSLALDRLAPAERETLRGVVFSRGTRSPRAPARELAYFDPSTEPPTLWFFDLAFASDDAGFVGRVDAPIPPGAMTAMHEFAHVIADAPLRRSYRAYVTAFEAWQADREGAGGPALRRDARDRYRTYVQLGRSGPVIGAWQRLRDGRRGPSTYGFRDPDESFAEGFALYHLDPEALERAMPGAVTWFASGAHLAAAGLSPSDAGE